MAFERIDGDFVLKHGGFKRWTCVKLGFENNWVNALTVGMIADALISKGIPDVDLLNAFDLSQLQGREESRVMDLLSKLCDSESRMLDEQHDCWKLWLLVGLLWLCEHERFVKDPLAFAEDLVDDLVSSLGYRPIETRAWIRFMPADKEVWDPTVHSSKENYQQLMSKWKAFLSLYAKEYLKDYDGILRACNQSAPDQLS